MNFIKNFFSNILEKIKYCLNYFKSDKLKIFIQKIKSYVNNIISKSKYIKKVNKKLLIIFVGIIGLFILGTFVGDMTHKEDVFIKKVEKAFEKGNSRYILKILKTEDNIKLSKKDIKPLMEFYKKDSSRVKTLVSSLRKGKTFNSLSLYNNNGSYYLKVDLSNMKIKSNFQGSNIYINETFRGTIDENEEFEVKNLVPGIYNITIENKSTYGEIKEKAEVILNNNEEFYIPIDGQMITVNSNFKEGTVYINGKSSDIKVKDFVDIGPFNKEDGKKILVKADTPWGILSSQESVIGEQPVIELNIDLKDSKIMDEINDTINRFYFSVFKSLNSQNKDDIVNTTNNVKNQIYSILNKEYIWLKNNYEVSDLQIKINNSEVNFDGANYTGNIVVTVSYKVSKQIFGLNIKSEEYSKNFFTEVKYKDGKWVICNIDNFSLDGLKNVS